MKSAADYEGVAIEIATQPEKALHRQVLAANRLAAPLFDTRLFTRHLEAAFTAMVQRHQAGQPPDAIVVPG